MIQPSFCQWNHYLTAWWIGLENRGGIRYSLGYLLHYETVDTPKLSRMYSTSPLTKMHARKGHNYLFLQFLLPQCHNIIDLIWMDEFKSFLRGPTIKLLHSLILLLCEWRNNQTFCPLHYLLGSPTSGWGGKSVGGEKWSVEEVRSEVNGGEGNSV